MVAMDDYGDDDDADNSKTTRVSKEALNKQTSLLNFVINEVCVRVGEPRVAPQTQITGMN